MKNQRPFLVVDAGNSLFKSRNNIKLPSQESLKAEGIISIYNKIGYSAVNIGPYDVQAGLSFLKKNAAAPWISSNFYSRSGESIFPPYITQNLNGLQIGIIGITDAPARLLDDVEFRNWSAVLPDLIKEVEKYCQFIVLLSTLSQEENAKIAKQFPSLRLIISASLSHNNVSPKIINNAILTQTERRGKYLGLLTIANANSKIWKNDNQHDITYQKRKLAALEWQILRLKSDQSQLKNSSAKLNKLHSEKKHIETVIEKLTDQQAPRQDSDIFPTTYSTHFIALSSNIPEDKEIEDEVNNIKDNINTLNMTVKNKAYDKGIQKKNTVGLVGYLKCSQCHQKQTDFWNTTAHAHAYLTLETKKASNNLECIICHVTQDPERLLYSPKESSFLLSLKDDLKTVGCESCHGSGLSHVKNPSSSKMKRQITSKVCQNCHTTERDGDYHFMTKRVKIACPAD